MRLAGLAGVIDNPRHASDSMHNETGRLSDRPGSDAESALESAARLLRAVPCPVGGVSARQREIFFGRQARDLLTWARENSLLTEAASYTSLAQRGGEEHRIWPSADRARVFKATYAGACGFTVIAADATGNLPELTNDLPLEYLERLRQQNRVFGDDLRLEGVALEGNGIVILTSQPTLVGQATEAEEFSDFMRRLWFQPLPNLHLGRPGALAFYRDLDEVAAFDAHPANFVKDLDGIVLPIDLILVQADSALQTALMRYAA